MGLRQGPPLLQCMGQVLRQRVCVGRWCGSASALQTLRPAGLGAVQHQAQAAPLGFKVVSCAGSDHAAFALGYALPSAFNLQLQCALQAEEHLEVIVAVAAGRRPVAPQ